MRRTFVLLLMILSLVGCGSDDQAATAGGPTAIRATVTDGAVQGGVPRVEAARGSEISVTVESDAADLVHVHGYDLEQPVAPGEPATVTFEAVIPGVFQVELEEGGLQIAELTVQG